MIFTNGTEGFARRVVATDYWESPEAQAGLAIVSYLPPDHPLPPVFRILIPTKSQQKAGGTSYIPLLTACHGHVGFSIDTDSYYLQLSWMGCLKSLMIPWGQVHGLTAEDVPEDQAPCRIEVYTWRDGPHLSHDRKAMFCQLPF